MNSDFLRLSRRVKELEKGTSEETGSFLRNDSRYLSSTCEIEPGSNVAHSLRGGSNTTNSSGFPSTYGQYWHFSGSSRPRDLTLWTKNGGENLYFQTYDYPEGSPQGWNEIWHSGNDGAESGLDADTVDGMHYHEMVSTGTYSYHSGMLVATDIAATSNTMFRLTISGNGYSTGKTLHIIAEGYHYQSGNSIINYHASALDYKADVYAFDYNGKLHFWFGKPTNYSSVNFFVEITNSGDKRNHVTTVTNTGLPSSGRTRTVVISPKQVWHSGNDGSGSGLDADKVDGIHASYTRNAAHTIPVRDQYGYLQLGWINTTSGDVGNIQPYWIYCGNTSSGDNYIRKITFSYLSKRVAWRHIRRGRCTINTSSWIRINFSSALPGTPEVVLTSSQSKSNVINGKARNINSTGFEGVIGGSGFSSGVQFSYIAVWHD